MSGMKFCPIGHSYFVTTGTVEYTQLIRDSEMLAVVKRMLQVRLDKTGYARIDDICDIFGMHYVGMEDDEDE